MFNIVLLEPEIPSNTGNIGRTCLATGTRLHLIEPMGFKINDKELKRAGLDYWKDLDCKIYDCYEDFLEQNPDALNNMFFATTKGKNRYSDVDFKDNSYIMFGKESAGIPEEILIEKKDKCIRIPMGEGIRSLNLANSVAVVLYEALRQNDFLGLQTEGELHRLKWND
ncbi:MAG: tRNA (uridine(34)/cytosine(34)/5-carboxymethylaminomethyluridine(34)-2'-O)-methyltransferase TrmL [Lachnospiraceae bacterium]|nr:tRNA (uridine(34)/cytosine(34)/5-carboxymethylaminomethyluridine(34)-2'-O)-methyltransferase TrmL [Lachnospiraceae bacterium]